MHARTLMNQVVAPVRFGRREKRNLGHLNSFGWEAFSMSFQSLEILIDKISGISCDVWLAGFLDWSKHVIITALGSIWLELLFWPKKSHPKGARSLASLV